MSISPALTSGSAATAVGSDDLGRFADDGGSSQADPVDDVRLLWAADKRQRIQGVWWPRTHDIAREVTALLSAADAYLGAPMTRVSLNPDVWDRQPRRLYADSRIIRIGWFDSIDPAIVAIGDTPTERTTLCMVPATWAVAAGRKLFAALREADVWPTEPGPLLESGMGV